MFDDLIDPDPPRPGLETLASVSERARRMRRRRDAARVLGLGAVAGLLVGSLAFVVDGDPDQPSEIAVSLDSGQEATVDLGSIVGSTTSTVTTPAGTVALPVQPVPSFDYVVTTPSIPPPTSSPVDTATTLPGPVPISYLAVGDTVMMGAAPELIARGLVVDAEPSRQMIDVIPLFEELRDRDLFGTAVVVHLGTNGPITQETLDSFLATMDGVLNVIILTVKADRPWTAENNALLRAADLEGDNKILIDWEALSAECPGECFYEDGIHLRPDGQQYYANLISDILGL